MIKAIFFDFDLTLVNSRPAAKASFNAVYDLTGQKKTKKEFRKFCGSKIWVMVDEHHKASGVPKKKIVDTFHKAYLSKVPKTKFYAKRLFSRLKGKKIIILTSNTTKAVKAVCKYHKIKYDMLITDDDLTRKQGKHDGILKGLRKFKLKKSEALFVGDHIIDVKEAHKAGIKSVIVPTGVFKKLYIKRFHPDFMVSNIDKVEKLVK